MLTWWNRYICNHPYIFFLYRINICIECSGCAVCCSIQIKVFLWSSMCTVHDAHWKDTARKPSWCYVFTLIKFSVQCPRSHEQISKTQQKRIMMHFNLQLHHDCVCVSVLISNAEGNCVVNDLITHAPVMSLILQIFPFQLGNWILGSAAQK